LGLFICQDQPCDFNMTAIVCFQIVWVMYLQCPHLIKIKIKPTEFTEEANFIQIRSLFKRQNRQKHSYAAHLLDLRYIQEILGYKSSKTTEIYTHVSNKMIQIIVSPFDYL